MDPNVVQPKTQNMLGFQPGRFQDVSLPIDCQDLIYGARILKHSINGIDFPDLAWLVPDDLASPNDICPTLIAVNTIAITDSLVSENVYKSGVCRSHMSYGLSLHLHPS